MKELQTDEVHAVQGGITLPGAHEAQPPILRLPPVTPPSGPQPQ